MSDTAASCATSGSWIPRARDDVASTCVPWIIRTASVEKPAGGHDEPRNEWLAVLDRPWRDVHRRRRPPPRWRPRHPQAPLRQSGTLPRRRHPGHPRPAGHCTGNARHGRRHRQDGYHGRHQRAPRAQGRSDPARGQPGIPRRASHWLPDPAASVRPSDHPPGNALRTGGGGGRPGGGRRPGADSPRPGRGRGGHARGVRRRDPVGRHRAHARLPAPRARACARPSRPRDRIRPGVHRLRDEPADEARRPRRHHGGGCVPLAVAAPLHRPGGGRARRERAPDVHAVERRPHRRPAVPGQGRHPVRSGRRHRGRGRDRGARGLRAHHLVRHGRDLDRRRPLRRRLRAGRSRPWWRGCACGRR